MFLAALLLALGWSHDVGADGRDAWQQPALLTATLGLEGWEAVADIGAGDGYFMPHLCAAVPDGKVFSVELWPDRVLELRAKARTDGLTNAFAVQGSPLWPGLPQPVDALLLCNSYHHLPARIDCLSALQGALAAQGRVFIVDFAVDCGSGGSSHFVCADRVVEEMASVGFELQQRFDDLLEAQYILVFGASPPNPTLRAIDTGGIRCWGRE